MKKIITLLFCTALLSSAFAQNNHHDDWNHDNDRHGNRRHNNNHNVYQNNKYNTAQRDQLIQRINTQYDYKIQQVSIDRYMNRREKRRAIKSLQAQKEERINRIYSEYNNRHVYTGKRNHDDKHNGRDNGNGHYNR